MRQQLDERQKIFQEYLPNKLISNMINEEHEKESAEITAFRAKLEEEDKKRRAELEKFLSEQNEEE